jgi:hypothetical protein
MPAAESPLGDPLLPDLRVDGATCAVDFSSGALSWSGMHGGVIVATLVRAAELGFPLRCGHPETGP